MPRGGKHARAISERASPRSRFSSRQGCIIAIAKAFTDRVPSKVVLRVALAALDADHEYLLSQCRMRIMQSIWAYYANVSFVFVLIFPNPTHPRPLPCFSQHVVGSRLCLSTPEARASYSLAALDVVSDLF